MSFRDIRERRKGYAAENEGLRGRLSTIFRRELGTTSSSIWNGKLLHLKSNKNTSFNIYEDVDKNVFHDIFEIARKYTENGELVDLHDNYDNCKCYLSDDGLSGFAITNKGDLISVFNANNKKGFLYAIREIVKSNVKTLDCYMSENQPLQIMYNKIFGFKTASIMDYNMEYDHDDIAKNHKKPQVAFMVNTNENIETKHFKKNQYEEAVSYQQSILEKSKKGVRYSKNLENDSKKEVDLTKLKTAEEIMDYIYDDFDPKDNEEALFLEKEDTLDDYYADKFHGASNMTDPDIKAELKGMTKSGKLIILEKGKIKNLYFYKNEDILVKNFAKDFSEFFEGKKKKTAEISTEGVNYKKEIAKLIKEYDSASDEGRINKASNVAYEITKKIKEMVYNASESYYKKIEKAKELKKEKRAKEYEVLVKELEKTYEELIPYLSQANEYEKLVNQQKKWAKGKTDKIDNSLKEKVEEAGYLKTSIETMLGDLKSFLETKNEEFEYSVFYSDSNITAREQERKVDYVKEITNEEVKQKILKSKLFNDLTLDEIKMFEKISKRTIYSFDKLIETNIIKTAINYNDSKGEYLEKGQTPNEEQATYFKQIGKKYNEGMKGKDKGKKACIVLGIASGGKSSAISTKLLKKHNAFEIDMDIAKALMEKEFDGGKGANYCHNASKYIIENEVLPNALKEGVNCVIQTVGGESDFRTIDKYYKMLIENGYEIELYQVSLPKEKALNRAFGRFIETGRYVDLEYINGTNVETISKSFDEYKEKEGVVYYERFNNDVPRGKEARSIENSEEKRITKPTRVQKRESGGDESRGNRNDKSIDGGKSSSVGRSVEKTHDISLSSIAVGLRIKDEELLSVVHKNLRQNGFNFYSEEIKKAKKDGIDVENKTMYEVAKILVEEDYLKKEENVDGEKETIEGKIVDEKTIDGRKDSKNQKTIRDSGYVSEELKKQINDNLVKYLPISNKETNKKAMERMYKVSNIVEEIDRVVEEMKNQKNRYDEVDIAYFQMLILSADKMFHLYEKAGELVSELTDLQTHYGRTIQISVNLSSKTRDHYYQKQADKMNKKHEGKPPRKAEVTRRINQYFEDDIKYEREQIINEIEAKNNVKFDNKVKKELIETRTGINGSDSFSLKQQNGKVKQSLETRIFKLFLKQLKNKEQAQKSTLEFMERVLKAEEEILESYSKLYVVIPKKYKTELMETKDKEKALEVIKKINNEMNKQNQATFSEKVEQFRIMSMLSNLKTHIRNIIGNMAMRQVVKVKNVVKSGLENFLISKNENSKWHSKYKTSTIKWNKELYKEVNEKIFDDELFVDSSKYHESNVEKKVFNNRILETIRKTNYNLLSIEDARDCKIMFSYTFTKWMLANNYTMEDITSNSELKATGMEYAIKEANRATFKEFSVLANKLNEIQAINGVYKVMVSSIIPFKRTPINIAKQGVRYSPL